MTETLHDFLGPELLSIYTDGEKLLTFTSSTTDSALPVGRQVYSDYSFVVFPFAKVYEGFLKKLFLQIGAINEYQYNNDRWRVGRALNPQLEKDLRHTESVYDRLVEHCRGSFDSPSASLGVAQDSLRSAPKMHGGDNLADVLWRVWKKGRNQIFHFWPGRTKSLSLPEAKEIIGEIGEVMETALQKCAISNGQYPINGK